MITQLLRSTDDLEGVRAEWEALWLADSHATPFQHPAWLLPWWRYVGEGDLATVALRDVSGVLTALVPAYIYPQPDSERRDLLLLGAGTSDYLGGLFADASLSGPALEALLASPHWDYVDLHQLRADSPLCAAIRSQGFLPAGSEPCAVALTEAGARPAKLRLNINRYRHRAEERGKLRPVTAVTAAQALDYLETLIVLHTRRWEERGEHGVLANASIQQHHRASVPLLFSAGLLHMVALYLDLPDALCGSPIAILYGLIDPPRPNASPRRFYAYLIGIDPSFADLSPGTLLLAALFEECAREQIPIFDMLRGGEAYKRLWGAQPEPTFAVRVARVRR